MTRTSPPRGRPSARLIAADAVAGAAAQFPGVDPQSLDLSGLEPRDRRLALAIHRATLQRWLTLDHLINLFLKRPLRTLEPLMQGVLLTGAAQLLFMDRLPVHAVVDESVTIARKRIRPGAAGMVNAVLRRVSELIDQPARDKPWSPAADRLPLDDGFLPLRSECLPPVDMAHRSVLGKHLAVVTSHPLVLIERWLKQWDNPTVAELCRHGTKTPPTMVAVEAEAEGPRVEGRGARDEESDHHHDVAAPEAALAPRMMLAATPGFILWEGTHAELTQFLAGHPMRRVQDVTSAEPCRATASLSPSLIIDYCAGRGTKTRQLAAIHSAAKLIATDTDSTRLGTLREAFAQEPRVSVMEMHRLTTPTAADLLVLDVPCTNTGVLARRPEARYRYNDATLRSLVRLQRTICEQAWPLVKPGGHVLYSTCSIDQAENQEQTSWLCERFRCEVIGEKLTLPGGIGPTYHDGGYFALLKARGE